MNRIAGNFLRYDPAFVEEAVFTAVRSTPREKSYHRERERIYQAVDVEERERAFRDLNGVWFAALGLARPIEQAVGEEPLILSSVDHCLVARAAGKKNEGAELFVTPAAAGKKARPTICMQLQPASLRDAGGLLPFLRHELLHIADMVDPSFGYEPALPAAEGGPTHDRLLKDRYRVLWDATIDGRMTRRGWATASLRADRLEEFARAFPMLSERTEDLFGRFFDGDARTHAELVAFAVDPRADLENSRAPLAAGSRCALCGFSTFDFEPEPARMPAALVAGIQLDFPRWRPADGVCRQCAELYRAREMSLLAARELPRAG